MLPLYVDIAEKFCTSGNWIKLYIYYIKDLEMLEE